MILTFVSLVNFGDGIEINLPGVMTQKVSCELALNRNQEGMLGCVLYLTLLISIVIAGPLADRFGRRRVLVFSLYTSVLVSIFCAAVVNFPSLLISRGLVGVAVGFNIVIHCILAGDEVSCKAVRNTVWLVMCVAYSLGGVWVAVMGYLVFDTLGWRVFIVITTMPVLVLSIFILHFYLPSKGEEGSEDEVDTKPEKFVSNVFGRTLKASIFQMAFFFQNWTTILLLPALIKLLNMKKGAEEGCDAITQGPEFLYLAVVAFAEVVGQLIFHIFSDKIRFRSTFGCLVVMMIGSYLTMLLMEGLTVVVLTSFLVKCGVGMMMLQNTNYNFHADYYGTKWLNVCSSLAQGVAMSAGLVGAALASFAVPVATILTALGLSGVQFFAILTMREIELL